MNKNTNILVSPFNQTSQFQTLYKQSVKGLFTFYREQEQYYKNTHTQNQMQKQLQSTEISKNKSKLIIQIKDKSNQERSKSKKKTKQKKLHIRQAKSLQRRQKYKYKSKGKRLKTQIKIQSKDIKPDQIQSNKTLPIKIIPAQNITQKFLQNIKKRKLQISRTTQINSNKESNNQIANNQVQQNLISNLQQQNILAQSQAQRDLDHVLKQYKKQIMENQKISISADLKKNLTIFKQQKKRQDKIKFLNKILENDTKNQIKARLSKKKRNKTQIQPSIPSTHHQKSQLNNFVRNYFYSDIKKYLNDNQIKQQIKKRYKEDQPVSPPSLFHEQKQLPQSDKKQIKLEQSSQKLRFPRINNNRQLSKIKSISSLKQEHKLQKQPQCQRCLKLFQQYEKLKNSARLRTQLFDQSNQGNSLVFIQLGKYQLKELNSHQISWQNKKNMLLKKFGIKM